MSRLRFCTILELAVAACCAVLAWAPAGADPLAYQAPLERSDPIFNPPREPHAAAAANSIGQIPAQLRRHIVRYAGGEPPGTIIIDTPNTYLYYVTSGGTAIRYGIGVGREGFAWSGVKVIDHKTEWPDWIPPPEMIQRQPYLPRFMAGGPGNPLGARAIYLGGTLFRIHGTNAPATIGRRVSSGCIRMLNEDVIDLYGRVSTGTRVVVLPIGPAAAPRAPARERPARAGATVAAPVRAFGIY